MREESCRCLVTRKELVPSSIVNGARSRAGAITLMTRSTSSGSQPTDDRRTYGEHLTFQEHVPRSIARGSHRPSQVDRAKGRPKDAVHEIGRASCRERVCAQEAANWTLVTRSARR